MSVQPNIVPTPRPATYQDVLAAPPRKIAEVIDGVLYTQPRPASRHAKAGSSLDGEIGGPFERRRGGGPGGWWVLYEPELHLVRDILVPDLAGWRRERMPEYPDVAFFTLAPDWVCEILSPSTRHLDLGRKRDIYAREEVAYLWIVDPDARTLEAFELRRGAWVSVGSLRDDAPVSLPPFDAISFPLDALWPWAVEGEG